MAVGAGDAVGAAVGAEVGVAVDAGAAVRLGTGVAVGCGGAGVGATVAVDTAVAVGTTAGAAVAVRVGPSRMSVGSPPPQGANVSNALITITGPASGPTILDLIVRNFPYRSAWTQARHHLRLEPS